MSARNGEKRPRAGSEDGTPERNFKRKIGGMTEYDLWKVAHHLLTVAETKRGTTPFTKTAKLSQYKRLCAELAKDEKGQE